MVLFGLRTWSKRILAIVSGVLLILLFLWLGNRHVLVREMTTPDHFAFGKVGRGARVEFGAQFLVPAGRHPFDQVFERIAEKFPASWEPALSKLHPSRFRLGPPPVDPATLKPTVQSPPFIRVLKTTAESRTNMYRGWPFVTLELELETSRAGSYSGDIVVTLNGRRAALPVQMNVREDRPEHAPRVLVATTPFQFFSTSSGADLEPAADVMGSLGVTVDYRRRLPDDLDLYRVILLADSAIVSASSEERARVRAFVRKGGRVILACDAFMSWSVPQANSILEDCGLLVVDQDFAGPGVAVATTNITSDPLTVGVRQLQFHRPSLIQVTDPALGKSLAGAPAGRGAFVAVSRPRDGGEIVVLTSSLWWWWLHQYQTNSDNATLLRQLLVAEPPAR
jgi:hypothetical protein